MKMTFRMAAIAASTVAFAALFSPGWSEQGGITLSIEKADAAARVYIRSPYYAYHGGYSRFEGLPWYAVRAYYMGGPWSGPGITTLAGLTTRRATALAVSPAQSSKAAMA